MLWRAFLSGFEGYRQPVDLTEDEFRDVSRSEGIDYEASLVALTPDREAVGVALLMIRGDQCWCGGLGVAPPFRRAGIGRRLMEGLIATARARGLAGMRLEVLWGNQAAFDLYRSLGFVSTQRLETLRGRLPMFAVENSDGVTTLQDPESVWTDFAAYHVVRPPWQREVGALREVGVSGRLSGFALGNPTQPDAYLLIRPGDEEARVGGNCLPQTSTSTAVAIIDSGIRRDVADPVGTVRLLLGALAAAKPDHTIIAANIPEQDPLNIALRQLGLKPVVAEQEMELCLNEQSTRIAA